MINSAVIGLGNMGKHHARVYSELLNSRLIAVADIDRQTGQQVADKFNCRFYADYREMIKEERIEAVSIAVPTFMHKDVALCCLERGINVLIEKPIAGTLEDAREITYGAQQNGLILQVGHIEHFNPAILRLKQIIRDNTLGSLLTVVVRRVGITPPQIRDANVIVDLAIHDIELCNSLMGKVPDKVYCKAGTGILPDREDYADFFLEYNGVNVLIQSNWITPVKIRQMHLTGTKGYAELDFIEQKLSLAETLVEHDYDDYGAFVVKLGQSNMINIPIERAEPLKLEVNHFLECVLSGCKPDVDGERATDALQIALDAWNISTRHAEAKKETR